MKRLDVLHIYAGTGGAAGTYIDGIFSALNGNFSQECIVNYYFPFKYGKKVFYKVTEMSGANILSSFPRVRLGFRMLELIYALFFSLLYIFKHKPKVINYSMTSNLKVEYFFLKCLNKYSSCTLLITCHDVLPFQTGYSSYDEDVKKRKTFFCLADFLLVHNENSKKALIKYFDIHSSHILEYKFPIMDLKKIQRKDIGELEEKSNFIKILFIGHMRKEKGIEILIEAWKGKVYDNLHLTIAGNVPSGFDFDFSSIESDNFTLIDKFLNDKDFVELIHSNDFVVLPYTNGTNSGFPSSIISLGSIPLTSNIPMFSNNSLIDKLFVFNSDDKDSLTSKFEYISALSVEEQKIAKQKSMILLDAYAIDFKEEVNGVYDSIIKHVL